LELFNDDKEGYELLSQGAYMLKFRESIKNIYDYLCEIKNLGKMEERDLEGIKRTMIMIFHLFDAKCMKESKSKAPIYYCFSHVIKDCKRCLEKELKDIKISSGKDVQQLLDKKYSDKISTAEIILGNNDEELEGQLIIKDYPNLEKVSINNSFANYLGNKRVKKLKIVNCPNLKELNCRFHELSELDTSELPNLIHLDCQVNKIERLDLRKNTQLFRLVCVNNRLTELDLSKNIYLTELLCHENRLVSLNVSNNENLTWLECFRNPLKTSDIKISKKIGYFGAYPLGFLVRQGEDTFLTAKRKE